jgi:hypothetical protein
VGQLRQSFHKKQLKLLNGVFYFHPAISLQLDPVAPGAN